MTIIFENPLNGYKETAHTNVSWLWCLLCGPLYFAAKGNWAHAATLLLAALCSGGIAWFIYPFFVKRINVAHYGRRGWKQVRP